MAAALLMSATAMAQDETSQARPGQKRFSQTEMVQKWTDRTVKKYGLNDEQAAKLMELNTKYADKIGPGFRRPGQHPNFKRGNMPDRKNAPDSLRDNNGPRKFQGNPGRGGNPEEMRKAMEEYESQLKAIMTDEQYKAYQADRENMRRGGRGRQPHRNN